MEETCCDASRWSSARQELKPLINFKFLNLAFCEHLTDQCLPTVFSLPVLSTLLLNGCRVTDAGMQLMPLSRKLFQLFLFETLVTESASVCFNQQLCESFADSFRSRFYSLFDRVSIGQRMHVGGQSFWRDNANEQEPFRKTARTIYFVVLHHRTYSEKNCERSLNKDLASGVTGWIFLEEMTCHSWFLNSVHVRAICLRTFGVMFVRAGLRRIYSRQFSVGNVGKKISGTYPISNLCLATDGLKNDPWKDLI